MDIKFQLPNPNDCSVEEFFSQIRISITAAEKSYQNRLKMMSPEEAEETVKSKGLWIYFDHSPEVEDAVEASAVPDLRDDLQEIYIAVREL